MDSLLDKSIEYDWVRLAGKVCLWGAKYSPEHILRGWKDIWNFSEEEQCFNINPKYSADSEKLIPTHMLSSNVLNSLTTGEINQFQYKFWET